MRILTVDEAAKFMGVGGFKVQAQQDLASFFENINWQYPDPVPSYFSPQDSSKKVILARLIANTLLDRGPALLWLTEFGTWGDAEQPDIFLRYRASYGEMRSIVDAPVHFFDTTDRVPFISFLCIALFFNWGAEMMNQDRSLAMTISHDEWLEYRFAPGQEAFISYFQKWIEPCLQKGAALDR